MIKYSIRRTLINYSLPVVIAIILLAFVMLSGSNAGIKDYWPVLFIPALALLFSFFRDKFGLLCVLLAFLPFSRGGLEFELGIISFNPYTLGMIGFTVISFILLAAGKYKFSFGILDVLIVLLCFSYLSSTLLSPKLVASGFIAFHAIFMPVITYFVLKTWIRTTEDYERLIWFFIAGTVLISIAGLVHFVLTGSRASAFNMPPIGMAGMAMVGLLLMVTDGKWKSPLGKVIIAILLLGLIASLSRMYIVVLLLAPFLYIWIKAGKGLPLFVSVFAITLAGTVILASIPDTFVPEEYDKTQEGTLERVTNIEYWKNSLLARGYSYQQGLKQFVEKPVFGWGFIFGSRPRHSIHIEFLEYGGLIGYLLYLSIFLAYFKRVSKRAKNDPILARNILIVLVVIFNSIFNPFSVGMNPYIIFIMMGLSEAHLRIIKNRKKSFK